MTITFPAEETTFAFGGLVMEISTQSFAVCSQDQNDVAKFHQQLLPLKETLDLPEP